MYIFNENNKCDCNLAPITIDYINFKRKFTISRKIAAFTEEIQ